MKKAIVTGANGFLGTAVCEELLKKGYEIIAVVRHNAENIDNEIFSSPKIRVVYCDISNFVNLAYIIEDRDVNVFYHFAWIGTSGALRGNIDTQINNVKYTCDTIKACAAMNCKRFVFAASVMEYEITASMAAEKTLGINTLYCSAKLSADYMARTLAGALGIDYIRAVISNIYGPGENSPRLINTSLRKMLNNEHCSFSAGEQIYDFIYITDAAKIFAILGEKGKNNKTYYIGSKKPKPLKIFLKEIRDCVSPEIKISLGELPFDGVSLTYQEFDINAVENDTGFIPEVSFKDGINKTIAWLKEVQ